jgi:outer membrane protein assembly factor BamE (lipoprotein component of BamABCDE complex)
MRRSFIVALRAIAVGLAVALAFAAWFFIGHGIDVKRFAQVQPGMTMAQVEAIMGKPGGTSPERHRTFWFYGSRFTLCKGIICFHDDEKVFSKFHDH